MIKVLKPGFYSTIQDLGRFGSQHYGVPISGTMDSYSALLANTLLGNDGNTALIEMTMSGITLQFQCDTLIALSGANMNPKLNGIVISNNKAIAIKTNDILSFGKLNNGMRCYLAVLGGFLTENVLASRSMYKGITNRFRLQKGDDLIIEKPLVRYSSLNSSLRVNESYLSEKNIAVFEGPEFNLLSDTQKKQLFNINFTVSKNYNRMGYQLNEVLNNNIKPIITSPVLPGTVQLTPSGKLIVLMRDCQTTGGYPRILQLKESSINVLSQKSIGESLLFKLINV